MSNSVLAIMPNKHDINYDFPGPDFSTEYPGLLHAPPGLEAAAPPVYRGPGGQEGPGAPCGEEVPHNQTGPGTSGTLPSARVWSLASIKTAGNVPALNPIRPSFPPINPPPLLRYPCESLKPHEAAVCNCPSSLPSSSVRSPLSLAPTSPNLPPPSVFRRPPPGLTWPPVRHLLVDLAKGKHTINYQLIPLHCMVAMWMYSTDFATTFFRQLRPSF